MEMNLISVLLFVFSLNAFAEFETKPLEDLQKTMVSQGFKIKDKFEKHKMKTDSGIYQQIWVEEFNVIDYIEVVNNSIELFKIARANVRADEGSLAQMRIEQIVLKMSMFCDFSSINLKEYEDEIMLSEVRSEVAHQVDNAQKVCSFMHDLHKKQ